jgi:hypothetical protein
MRGICGRIAWSTMRIPAQGRDRPAPTAHDSHTRMDDWRITSNAGHLRANCMEYHADSPLRTVLNRAP